MEHPCVLQVHVYTHDLCSCMRVYIRARVCGLAYVRTCNMPMRYPYMHMCMSLVGVYMHVYTSILMCIQTCVCMLSAHMLILVCMNAICVRLCIHVTYIRYMHVCH